MKQKIIHGDCLEEMKKIPDGSIDLVLTDPPYGLEFMGKDWDKGVPGVHFWVEMLRVLKPGGYLLAFSGTRTYHRMGTAIEDAGFEVRDMIEWVYGSGFPKSLNIGKSIESKIKTGSCAKNNFHKLDGERRGGRICMYDTVEEHGFRKNNPDQLGAFDLLATTEEAKQWEGWGTALKPAHEPICMARKPLGEKTVAENCLKYGTGGINIDESRVDFVSEEDRKESTTKNQHADFGTKPMTNNNVYGDYSMIEPKNFNPTGRFPANLIHDNSEEVNDCFPETKSQGHFNSKVKMVGHTLYEGGFKDFEQDDRKMNDCGNASRFFKSIIYTAKASKKDRGEGNNHPTVKPVALMEYLAKMCSTEGATILDPFMGSGTTGVACKNLNRNFTGIELDKEYFEIAKKRIEQSNL